MTTNSFKVWRVHQCDLPNVTRGGDMRSYWNFLLITILFHKMMKYKIFVNKARYISATLPCYTWRKYDWDHTETSFCFVRRWSIKCSPTLTKDEPQGYQNDLIELLISRNSAGKKGVGWGISWWSGEWLSHPVIVLVFKGFKRMVPVSFF